MPEPIISDPIVSDSIMPKPISLSEPVNPSSGLFTESDVSKSDPCALLPGHVDPTSPSTPDCCLSGTNSTVHAASNGKQVDRGSSGLEVHVLLAAKKHQARCLKILTQARLQTENETKFLIEAIGTDPLTSASSYTSGISVGFSPGSSAPLDIRDGSPRLSSTTFVLAKRAIDSIDLNEQASAVENSPSPLKKPRQVRVKFCDTPWDLGFDNMLRARIDTEEYYRWATSGSASNDLGVWVSHDVPSVIELSGKTIVEQFAPYGELSAIVIDCLFRVFTQIDSRFYGVGATLVWRHFMSTLFAQTVLSDENYMSNQGFLDVFVGSHISYDVSRCQMFICAAKVGVNQAAFTWDVKRRQATVYDVPSALCNDDPWGAHKNVSEVLLMAIHQCSAALFDDWQFEVDSWCHLFIDAGRQREFPSNFSDAWCESSVQAVMFSATWDGVKHCALSVRPTDHVAHRANLLYTLMHISDNHGRTPWQFVQYIDD